ncbi:MAG: endonuclease MutS2 [Sporomusaceae bacterium]|nr:endonuclease MutS2 [Sporomusaceae bacterium]
MDASVLKTLEFHKIRAMLAAATGSSLGREVAEVLEPVNHAADVQWRLDETQEAFDMLAAAAIIPLGGIRDIRDQLHRAARGSSLEPTDFVAIASTLYAARRMKQFFVDLTNPVPHLEETAAAISVFRSLESAIEDTISDQGAVLDSASPELARIRREIRVTQSRVKEKLDHIIHSGEYQKLLQDAIVTIRGDRYVIPVKQEYRHAFPGIVHDQSASGATVFIEPMSVVNLNNDLKQLMAAEINEIERILRHLTAQVAAAADPLLETCRALGQIDFAFAKARLALNMQAVRPLLNTAGCVNLRRARHPLIPAEVVVPIDVRVGKEFTVLVITGPNTGGKTVTLKTVGLFALMTQAGLFIPAASQSEMPVFANVFADIGDEQSIEQSLSTFSAHMTNLVRILGRVAADDLVLIDEIGAGTDPDEGAALAMSILEYLYRRGTRVIATTHYSELKTFAYSRHGIENASVEFDIQTLRPTYRLQIGMPGSSKAFLISQRLGLDAAIVARAQELIDEDYAEFDKVLTALEEQKRLFADRQDEVRHLQREGEELRRSLVKEKEALAEKKKQLIDKAQAEAERVLRQARIDAESVIADLKAQFASETMRERQQAIDGARRRLATGLGAVRALGDEADEREQGAPATADDLVPGAKVYVATLGQKGTVLAVAGDEVTVQLGIMKLNVPLASCRLAESAPARKESRSRAVIDLTKAQQASREVDIRGQTVEEAEAALDKYIDDAILAGLGEIIVIHGKGTGALKKGVRTYLKTHRAVRDIRIGEAGEGGDGVTVAKLK